VDLPLLPTLNACLNGLAFVLLVTGLIKIKQGQEEAHKKLMIGALIVSTLFLISYVTHHSTVGMTVSYAGAGWGKTPYLVMLLVHTVLAAAVPFLAIRTAYLGFQNRRAAHRKWAKVTAPIWLFVSISGVLIYFILYIWTDSYALALASKPS
jgi:putative membrane protein